MSEPVELKRLRLRYAGSCRACGTGLAPGTTARTETLMVGSRKSNPLVDGMRKQVRLVTEALAAAGSDVPVTGMLVFVDADWPLFGGDFATQGVKVLWPKKATEHILTAGPFAGDVVTALHRTLARTFANA
jgi:hypothetical protein